MHHGIELMDCEQPIEKGAIVRIANDEFDLEDGFYEVGMAIDEVVKYYDVVARFLEGQYSMGSDVACSASDKNFCFLHVVLTPVCWMVLST